MRGWLRKHYGHLYYVIGGAHIAIGVVQFWDEWRTLFRDGYLNQIDWEVASYQGLGYWYIILGPVVIATGSLAQSHLDATSTLPRPFSLIVAATAIAAGLAMYGNGIWAVGAVGLSGLLLATPAREEVNAGAGTSAPVKPVFEV